MHEHGLAKELWPELKQIAERGGFVTVSRVDMTVGSLHGISGELLAPSFAHAFEGTNFEGATVNVTVVDPGSRITAAGGSDRITTSGWELLVTRIEGQK